MKTLQAIVLGKLWKISLGRLERDDRGFLETYTVKTRAR
jgi:hypothetical protein